MKIVTLLLLCLATIQVYGKEVVEYRWLEEKEGILLYMGEPFTGTATSFFKGMKSRWEIKNGIIDGIYTLFFYNSQKCREGEYRKGKKQGKWVEWYENGQLRSVENYQNGQQVGKELRYNRNGQLNFEIIYENDNRTYRGWHENGRLSVQGTERDGVSKRICWYKNGNKKEVEETKNSKRHGTQITYYENGKKKYEQSFHEGTNHGLWCQWDKMGRQIFMKEYHHGVKHGKWIEWFLPSSNKSFQGEYKLGNRHGIWRKWHLNGQLSFEKKYNNGIPIGTWRAWDEKGNEAGNGHFVDGTGRWVLLYENGKKEKEEIYFKGKPHGKWMEWYENGRKAIEENYKEGKPHGTWLAWDINGMLEEKEEYHDGKLSGWIVIKDFEGEVYTEGSYLRGEKHGTWFEKDENGIMQEKEYFEGVEIVWQESPPQDEIFILNERPLLKKVLPPYPAIEQGVSDSVEVCAITDEEGRVVDAKRVGGFRDVYIAAALAAVKQWEFESLVVGGKKRRMQLNVCIDFDWKQRKVYARPGYYWYRAFRIITPEYPLEAREAKQSDIIEIEALTNVYGSVREMKVRKGTHLRLIKEALKAVKKWIVEYLVISGIPRQVKFLTVINFHEDLETVESHYYIIRKDWPTVGDF